MKTIRKYPLAVADQQTIEVPARTVFISAQMQRGRLCVWAIVDTSRANELVDLFIVGTGHPMPEVSKTLLFVGTVQEDDLVWHVFRGA